MENPFSVAVSDPLKPFATRFACALLRQGYQRQSARIQIELFAQLSAWLADVRLEPSELSSTHVARFLVARRRAGATRYVSPKALCAILTYLRDEGVVRVPVPVAVVGPVEKTLDAVPRVPHSRAWSGGDDGASLPVLGASVRLDPGGIGRSHHRLGDVARRRRYRLCRGPYATAAAWRRQAHGHSLALVPRLSPCGRSRCTVVDRGRALRRGVAAGRSPQGTDIVGRAGAPRIL